MTRREIPAFALRLRPVVKERVRRHAEENRRSMNTEIEMLLEEALDVREKRR